MAANTNPIFTIIPQASWVTVTAANTAMDGTGTVNLVFTADATDGSFVSTLLARPLGTNVASVMRVFINNGSTPTSVGNNSLIYDFSLPATTASNAIALAGYEVPINKQLPAGYRLYVTLGTAVSAGWAFTCFGGEYS